MSRISVQKLQCDALEPSPYLINFLVESRSRFENYCVLFIVKQTRVFSYLEHF